MRYFSFYQDNPAISVYDYCGGNVTQANLDLLLCATLLKSEEGGINTMPITAYYRGNSGSGAVTDLTIANYNGFPTGSVIWDYASTTKAVYLKTGATTWASETLT